MVITLNSGRNIVLSRMEQWRTYERLLAGLPYRDGNTRLIQEAMKGAEKWCVPGLKPYAIPPVVTPIPPPQPSAGALKLLGRTAEQLIEDHIKGNHEKLPHTACIGVFDSKGFEPPDPEPCSSMVLVWFQDDFALPVDPGVLEQMKALEWEKHAKDWSW